MQMLLTLNTAENLPSEKNFNTFLFGPKKDGVNGPLSRLFLAHELWWKKFT